jgi:hypothetical protein
MCFFRSFTFCNALVDALMIVLGHSPCERIEKWETCPILKEGRSLVSVWLEHLYRQWQFLRLCRHTRIMGRQHQRRGTMGDSQYWYKEIVVHSERSFRKITQPMQHRWIAAELNIHLEDPVSTKTVQRELHKSSIHGRAAIANTESNG